MMGIKTTQWDESWDLSTIPIELIISEYMRYRSGFADRSGTGKERTCGHSRFQSNPNCPVCILNDKRQEKIRRDKKAAAKAAREGARRAV
jgi:hypothetical protein